MKAMRMRKNDNPGKLITFCGLDGSGKSTMIDLVAEALRARGKRVFLTKQPTYSVRNSDIFRNFQDTDTHDGYEYLSLSMFAASDRIQHVSQVIVPKLKEVDYVISDRYIYSCLANLHARGYERDSWLYEIAPAIVKPDLAFFVDVPVDTAIERVRMRANERHRYIDKAFQESLRLEYLQMAMWPKSCLIDGTIPVRAEFAQIMDAIDQLEEMDYE